MRTLFLKLKNRAFIKSEQNRNILKKVTVERLSNTELKRVKQQIFEFIITMYDSFKARCRQKLRSNYRRFLTEIVVLEHQKWHFRASRFRIFLGERGGDSMPPDPHMIRGLRHFRQYLSENFIPI